MDKCYALIHFSQKYELSKEIQSFYLLFKEKESNILNTKTNVRVRKTNDKSLYAES